MPAPAPAAVMRPKAMMPAAAAHTADGQPGIRSTWSTTGIDKSAASTTPAQLRAIAPARPERYRQSRGPSFHACQGWIKDAALLERADIAIVPLARRVPAVDSRLRGPAAVCCWVPPQQVSACAGKKGIGADEHRKPAPAQQSSRHRRLRYTAACRPVPPRFTSLHARHRGYGRAHDSCG
jgi:hypothetical protein